MEGNYNNSFPQGQVLTSAAVALLEEMLDLNPEKRCSAAEALKAQYLAPYHDPTDEPVATKTFDISFLEASLTADAWKNVMYACSPDLTATFKGY
jgi:p38 MAP kinase